MKSFINNSALNTRRQLNTPFGNITTDPKLMHLTGEKLFFTCYNGEKPKPVVLIARPRIFAIFHRPGLTDSNSTETDESNSSEASNGSKDESDDNKLSAEQPPALSVLNGSSADTVHPSPETIRRNKRNALAGAPAMDCMCKCPSS